MGSTSNAIDDMRIEVRIPRMTEELFPFPMEETIDYPIVIQCAGRSDWTGAQAFAQECCPYYAFEYVHGGSGTLTENDETYTLTAGDLFILQRGSKHRYANAQGKRLVKTWIVVHGPLVDDLMRLYGLADVYHIPGMRSIAGTFEKLYDTAKKAYRGRWHGRRVAPVFALMTHEIISAAAHRTQRWRERTASAAVRMKRYIDEHIGERVSLAALADISGHSPSQAVRIFRKEFGSAPYAYVTERRIASASFLLSSTILSIREIAHMTGFSDEHYFSSFFKKRTGRTPSSVRGRS